MSRIGADVHLDHDDIAGRAGGVWRYPADTGELAVLARPARAVGWVRAGGLLLTAEDPAVLRSMAEALMTAAAELEQAQAEIAQAAP